MLPFETDTVLGEVTKTFYRVMPRVVPDQRSRFDNDELFRKLSREGEVRIPRFILHVQLSFFMEYKIYLGYFVYFCIFIGIMLM